MMKNSKTNRIKPRKIGEIVSYQLFDNNKPWRILIIEHYIHYALQWNDYIIHLYIKEPFFLR